MPEYVMPDLLIRGGLLDPKHCAAMGEAVWLYLYLQSIVRFTGEEAGTTFPGRLYQHADAVAALGHPRRTIERWFARLVQTGYVRITRRRLGYELTITKYEDVRQHTAERRSRPATSGAPYKGRYAASGVSRPAKNDQRYAKSDPRPAKSGASTNKDARAFPNDTTATTEVRGEDAASGRTLTPTQLVVNAWMAANGRDPFKAKDYARYVEVGSEVAALGYAPHDVGNCTKYLRSDPWRQQRGKVPRLEDVRDALPGWIEMERPGTFRPLAGREAAPKTSPYLQRKAQQLAALKGLEYPPHANHAAPQATGAERNGVPGRLLLDDRAVSERHAG